MNLYINTASYDEIIIALQDGAKIIAQKKIIAPRQQAEKLVPAIDRLLKTKKIKLSALKKIIVANCGGSFTSLRIGVITANALGYALKIPVVAEEKIVAKTKGSVSESRLTSKKFAGYSLVEPVYDSEPNIGISKKAAF